MSTPVAKRDPGPVPTSTPQFGAAEGRTQPVDSLLHVNVDEFRDHAGRSGRAIDQHDGPPHRIATRTLTADAPRATGPRTTIQSMLTQDADEHVQTSGAEHGDRHSPRPAMDLDSAGAARRVARVGRLAIRKPASVFSGRSTEGPCPVQVRRALIRTPTRHRAPDQEPGRTLIPGDEAAGDQGLRIGLRARH